MNIFALDKDPALCARYHIDKHVVKMVIEYCQLLSNAVWSVGIVAPYKKTHYNHPASKWARESNENYIWLWNLCNYLGQEYTYRYGKQHKSHLLLQEKLPNSLPQLPNIGFTNFVNCTTDKTINDVIEAYRLYYIKDKRYMAKWKGRSIPEWFI